MKRIIINNKIRFGKPILEGTRISVEDVVGMLESGMTYEEIEKEYGITKEDIMSVMKYLGSFIHGEHVTSTSS